MRYLVLDPSYFSSSNSSLAAENSAQQDFGSPANSNNDIPAPSKKETFALACQNLAAQLSEAAPTFKNPNVENLSPEEAQAFEHEFSRPSYSKFIMGLNDIIFPNVARKLVADHQVSLEQALFAIALIRQQGEKNHLQLGIQFQYYSEILNHLIQTANFEGAQFQCMKPDYQDILVSKEENFCAITFLGAGKIRCLQVDDNELAHSQVSYQTFIKIKIGVDLNIHFEPCVLQIAEENPVFSQGILQLEKEGLLSKDNVNSKSEIFVSSKNPNFIPTISNEAKENLESAFLWQQIYDHLPETKKDILATLQTEEVESERYSIEKLKSLVAIPEIVAKLALPPKQKTERDLFLEAKEELLEKARVTYSSHPVTAIESIKDQLRPCAHHLALKAEEIVNKPETSREDIQALTHHLKLASACFDNHEPQPFKNSLNQFHQNTATLLKQKEKAKTLGVSSLWLKVIGISLSLVAGLAIGFGIALTLSGAGMPIGFPIALSGLKLLALSIPLITVGFGSAYLASKALEASREKGVIKESHAFYETFHKNRGDIMIDEARPVARNTR